MPMDAYRKGDTFFVQFDLPGTTLDSIDLTAEQNVLTVHAQRQGVEEGVEMIVAERPAGTFTRQVFLGDTLDADNIEADYTAGVLTLRIPVREEAKPRTLAISSKDTPAITSG
jgi:HSP20 family protein